MPSFKLFLSLLRFGAISHGISKDFCSGSDYHHILFSCYDAIGFLNTSEENINSYISSEMPTLGRITLIARCCEGLVRPVMVSLNAGMDDCDVDGEPCVYPRVKTVQTLAYVASCILYRVFV